MHQYKFSIYFEWQIGFLLSIDEYTIDINIPFIQFCFGRLPDASGTNIKWIKGNR